jgi:hypothetical protein
MSQLLSVELAEQTHARLQSAAATAGTSPDELAARSIEREYGRSHAAPLKSKPDAQTASERFERHFGSVELGIPTGADNDGIDANLAHAMISLTT